MNLLAHLQKRMRMLLVGGFLVLQPIAHGINYSNNDLLLVFRKDGYRDVEFDLGSVNAFLGLAAGTHKSINLDVNLVRTNFGNSLTGVKFLVVGATGLGAEAPRLWLTDASTFPFPTDVTLSKFSQIRSKISSIGQQATILTSSNSLSLVVATSQPGSFTYIASDGNLTPASSLGGLTGYSVEAPLPATLDFYSIQISTANPRPPASVLGSFTVDTEGTLTFDVGNDLNSDLRPDLLFEDADGFIGYWSMNGATLTGAGYFDPNSLGDPNWNLIGFGDFNVDGAADLVFQHADGWLGTWLMDGTTRTSPEYFSPANAGPGWRLVGVRDIDGDGKSDLIFQLEDGSLGVWLLNGRTRASFSFLEPANPNNQHWKAVATGDFNDDGKWELVLQHDDGTLAFWSLDGTKLTDSCLLSPSNPGDPNWRVVAVADLDRDGKSDLIFQNQGDHSLAVWFMNGCTLTKAAALEPQYPGGTWKVVGPR